MLSLVVGRLVAMVSTLLVSSFVVFAALYVVPGDPVTYLSGGRAQSPEALAAVRSQYHLDDPLLTRYGRWLGGIARGDLGTSLVYREDVTTLIGPRSLTTVLLVGYASAIIVVFGAGLGVHAALRGGWPGGAISVGTTLLLAVPSFLTAIVLISVFAVQLGWFPVFGSGSGIADRLYHLTLPAVALALAAVGVVGRIARAATGAELQSEHVLTAHARGIPPGQILRRHVLRNAAIPITTVSGLIVASLIAGSAVIERAFALDGLGSYLIDAVSARDFPVVQGICLVLVAVFVCVNTLVDLLYGVLDPRVARGAELT